MNVQFSALDKVALVTGGASGIGRATATKFAEAGAHVAILDVNPSAGEDLAKAINSNGGSAHYINCDLRHEKEIQTAIGEIVKVFGRLDYAYNNAGIGGEFAKVERYPTLDWDDVMSINLRSVFLCMKYEIPHILNSKGAIVNCASVLGTLASAEDSAYVASK
ncbi:MAG: SDR family NAD(P)-dependent oxidoreductase, partial [Bacteroidetes bacterium]|nr:SDR family NAD(P)-dependent oxidoreductase [Bacteroidota bacterium]